MCNIFRFLSLFIFIDKYYTFLINGEEIKKKKERRKNKKQMTMIKKKKEENLMGEKPHTHTI